MSLVRWFNCNVPSPPSHFPSQGLDTFLVLVDRSDAYTISLDVPYPVNVRFPLPGVGILSAVAWDSRDDTLYFADLNRRTISATKFNVSAYTELRGFVFLLHVWLNQFFVEENGCCI